MKHLLDTRLNKVTNQDLVEVNAVLPFSNLHLDKLNWCCAFLFLVKTLRTLTPHPYYCYHWQQRGRKKRRWAAVRRDPRKAWRAGRRRSTSTSALSSVSSSCSSSISSSRSRRRSADSAVITHNSFHLITMQVSGICCVNYDCSWCLQLFVELGIYLHLLNCILKVTWL